MKVAVVGTGYVGLVTGACLAEAGHQVICIDNNEAKVASLKQGRIPIFEPGLEQIVRRNYDQERLVFTTDVAAGVQQAGVIFIAVGTPALPTGESDLRYVEAVARTVGEHLDSAYRVIVNKSTVPIGSGDWVRMLILEGVKQAKVPVTPLGHEADPVTPNFDVVSNPEFLKEGTAVWDTFNPDRIVVGSDSPKAIAIMRELYQPIVDREFAEAPGAPVPFVVTDLASAEMIKYAANAFLATKISFINEIANICERVGADVSEVAYGIGLDQRIGQKFLQAGLGWGGSCFPKDVAALVHTANDYGYDTRVLRAVVETNRCQRVRVIEKLQQELKVLKGKTVGLLGLTFKPDTDDMRDAPSLTLIEHLHKLGARVKAFDPIVSASGIREGLSNVIVETDAYRLAETCDALVLVTDWKEFRNLDFEKLAQLVNRPLIIDGRNFLDRQALTKAGFWYVGMGR
ncbi:UDP-glucose/GDP-mannose dehydrogenase family protein [Candidatus Cyanaurora vandensis]|uniref:UDP-glucose dehydrogenase family protein n=1 Tax=Candidatus Cyanaurora vandensis TaxID=2714958 RepID=UPI002579B66B|nr:UDP-glucose/GDP-mannose dehydrogenase family protein [Candidatus Cyanaurora vandensis]